MIFKKVVLVLSHFFHTKLLVMFMSNSVQQRWRRAISEITIDTLRDKRAKREKLHLVFYVCERSKWNCESIYSYFNNDERFRISIALGPNDVVEAKALPFKKLKEITQQNHDFFSSIGPDIEKLYSDDLDEFYNIETLGADIIFYQQPWGRMGNTPAKQLGKSLAIYIPYSYLLVDWDSAHYHRANFHPFLWRYYSQSEVHTKLHLGSDPHARAKIVTTGYPKLDIFLQQKDMKSPLWKDDTRKRIIYAPHHSVGNSNLRFSTFDRNYKFILELARASNKDIQWVYKPHPTIRKSVVEKGVMSENEYDQYTKEWQNLENANLAESGNYYELFSSSHALLTDCASFLAEYLPTKNPILHLKRDDSLPLNLPGKMIEDSLYSIRDNDQIKQMIDEVVLREIDPLKKKRLEIMNSIILPKGIAGKKIYDDITNELFSE